MSAHPPATACGKPELAAQAEKARALLLLAAIADNSSDAIFAKDREGRYLLANRSVERIVGKTSEQMLGQDDTVLFPQQAETIRANDRRVMAENRINSYEETIATAEGERTFLATKGPLHDTQGKVSGMFGISRDITLRKEAEEALRLQNAELQRFNRAMLGRERRMIELKQEINELCQRLGEPPRHEIPPGGGGA